MTYPGKPGRTLAVRGGVTRHEAEDIVSFWLGSLHAV